MVGSREGETVPSGGFLVFLVEETLAHLRDAVGAGLEGVKGTAVADLQDWHRFHCLVFG